MKMIARCRDRFSRGDHSGSDGAVGFGVNQNECAGRAIFAVEVKSYRSQQIDADDADAVHFQHIGGFVSQRADVGAMLDCGNKCGHRLAGVLE